MVLEEDEGMGRGWCGICARKGSVAQDIPGAKHGEERVGESGKTQSRSASYVTLSVHVNKRRRRPPVRRRLARGEGRAAQGCRNASRGQASRPAPLVEDWPFLVSPWHARSVSTCNAHRTSSSSGTVGILLGFTLVEPQDLQDLHAQLSIFVTEYGVPLPDFDFSRVEVEWQRLRNSIPEVWKFNNDGREFKVGEAMKARNLSAEYPVVLIPGIISTVRLSFQC